MISWWSRVRGWAMAREDIGAVACPFCGSTAKVRKSSPKKGEGQGKLYYSCPQDGLVMPLMPHFQNWMLEHATMWGADRAERQAAAAAEKTEASKNGGAEAKGGGEIVKPAPAEKVEPAKPAKKKKIVGVGMFAREVEVDE